MSDFAVDWFCAGLATGMVVMTLYCVAGFVMAIRRHDRGKVD